MKIKRREEKKDKTPICPRDRQKGKNTFLSEGQTNSITKVIEQFLSLT